MLLLITGLLLVLAYWGALSGMAEQWATDEDMSYGFAVPVVVAWVVYRERGLLSTIPANPSNLGLCLVLLAAALVLAGSVGAGLFVAAVGFWLAVAGSILFLGGWPYVRALGFPLFLMLFMLPKLAFVYAEVTLPLQLTATRLAGAILSTLGVTVVRTGNVLDLGQVRLSVTEACNGMRFLLSLAFLAVVFGYAMGPSAWIRWALLAATIPVAIGANALRVAAIGLLAAKDPALANGFLHFFSGWLVFLVSLAVLALVRKGLTRIHV
ncbi:exosortase [Paludibaculum fermentans]|uniref:exosortase n=1 Tax=Paludibaculum fermentans TaxID=1473598 RepID=UPI003EB74C93